ncbi:MAG: hypothetical protein GX615_13690, partial [Lentisphaerae bacterium]|nr:hypothetical protein [Lentisphaerota bacterium]
MTMQNRGAAFRRRPDSRGICLSIWRKPTMHHTRIIDVMACGAAGDGSTLDTAAVNRAIETCASKGGGQVFFPPGHYLSGTVVLRSHVSLRLEAGARLMGAPDLSLYQSYSAPAGTPEAKSPEWHRALVLGVNVEDVSIVGEGVIDGQCVFDAHGEEHMRGPHAVLIGSSHDVSIRGISLSDAANYAILIEFSDQIEVRDVKICGGWDGVHFRGWLDRPCKGLSIIGCRFFTGDDAIAGRYA